MCVPMDRTGGNTSHTSSISTWLKSDSRTSGQWHNVISMSSLGMALYRRGSTLLAGLGLRRYALVNRLNSLVLSCVRPHEAVVLGHRMLLDRRDSLNLSLNGIYEPLETHFVEELVPPGGCVVDIGANIGYYTLLCARWAGPTGQVYAFEPEPENFSL